MPADGRGPGGHLRTVGFLCSMSHVAHGSRHQVAPRSQGQALSQQKGTLLLLQLWGALHPVGGTGAGLAQEE